MKPGEVNLHEEKRFKRSNLQCQWRLEETRVDNKLTGHDERLSEQQRVEEPPDSPVNVEVDGIAGSDLPARLASQYVLETVLQSVFLPGGPDLLTAGMQEESGKHGQKKLTDYSQPTCINFLSKLEHLCEKNETTFNVKGGYMTCLQISEEYFYSEIFEEPFGARNDAARKYFESRTEQTQECQIVDNFSRQVASKKRSDEIMSDIFDVDADPSLKEMVVKSKKETNELHKRAQQKSKNKRLRKSMAKMAIFSQSQESLQQLTPPKKRFKSKKSCKEKVEAELEADYMPSIDELLKEPEKVGDSGKTMDEILDEFDKEIAERKEKHERESAKVQADIAAEKLRQAERRKRLAENAKLRDRLEIEITEEELRKLFAKNRVYLEGIWNGSNDSARHKAFHQSRRTRHALTYMMITDPFTDG